MNNLGDPMLINELNALSSKLTKSITYMKKAGQDYAQAEHDYKVAIAKEAYKLKDEGLAVTFIDKVLHGNVAEEKHKKDLAEVMYKTAQENIQAIKLQIRIIDNQISREYGHSGI